MNSLSDFYKTHQGKSSAKWERNLREYGRLFLPYQDMPVRTLEIGVQNGGSLDIFSEFFTQGEKFIGCDINPNCKNLTYDDPRISLIIGDANTDETQAEILRQSDTFDLIIDDGSHMPRDIVSSFARYFPFLKEGGIFIVEDLHCSYWQEFDGGIYHPYSSITFFKYLIDIINYEHWNTDKSRSQALTAFKNHFNIEFSEEMLSQVNSVEFTNSMCVISKSQANLVHLGEQVFSGKDDLIVANALFTPPPQQNNKWSILDFSPAESFNELSNDLAKINTQLTERNAEIADLEIQFTDKNRQITEQDTLITEQDARIREKDTRITELDCQIITQDNQIAELNSQINELISQTAELDKKVSERNTQITEQESQLTKKDIRITELDTQMTMRDNQLAAQDSKIIELISHTAERDAKICEKDTQISERDSQIATQSSQINEWISKITERDAQINAMINANSWRLTMPFRLVKEKLKPSIKNTKQWFVKILHNKYLSRLASFIRGEINTTGKTSLDSLRYHIDTRFKIFKIVKGSFLATGWCVNLNTCSAAKIRIRIGNRVYQPHIAPRAEVSEVFASICDLPDDVGFICVPSVPLGLHRMLIDIQDTNDSWITIRRALLLNIQHQIKGLSQTDSYKTKINTSKIKVENHFNQTVAVAYIARGADENWMSSCERFIKSYKHHSSGVNHTLYIIFKGFTNQHDLVKANKVFDSVSHEPVLLDDNSYDIGAYIEFANMVDEKFICVFNTASEILANDWLLKLANNIILPNVGLVGATGSYESLRELNSEFPKFPNTHIRSTAFMIKREYFCSLTKNITINSKDDAWFFESGPSSMTRNILSERKKILLVGRNGHGYAPSSWPSSDIFRHGNQDNLLVADNQTKIYDNLSWEMKKFTVFNTWGPEHV